MSLISYLQACIYHSLHDICMCRVIVVGFQLVSMIFICFGLFTTFFFFFFFL